MIQSGRKVEISARITSQRLISIVEIEDYCLQLYLVKSLVIGYS